MRKEDFSIGTIPNEHWEDVGIQHTNKRSRETLNPVRTDLLDPDDDYTVIEYKPCGHCKGEGVVTRQSGQRSEICPLCSGNTAFGVSPHETRALPGTKEKVAILAARYAQGLPLHREDDMKVCNEGITSMFEAV